MWAFDDSKWYNLSSFESRAETNKEVQGQWEWNG